MVAQELNDRLNILQSRYNIIDVVICDGLSDVDLYIKIKNLYRERFDDKDRIVFVLTQDYHDGDSPGLTLQRIQAMVNDVDISNYFVIIVTTNPDIQTQYADVLSKISTDKVPFHTEQCDGAYQCIPSQKSLTQKKYHDIELHLAQIKSLTEDQKKLLFDNNFCLMPWTGVYIGADSQVKPCCVSTLNMGDCSQNTLEEIWNSDAIKSVRRDFINGKQPSTCQGCYRKESLGQHSLRQSTNEKFVSLVSKIPLTTADGYYPNFDLKYWDIRYNNLCNLACRSCTPTDSSSWHQAAVYLNYKNLPSTAIRIAGKSERDIFQQMMEHIDSVESIYFAGGEPLMIEEFYIILEKLLERGRNHVRLVYNTNLTRTSLKLWNIFDLWRQFPNVCVGASLDGEHARGEYLREGTHWPDVINNRRQMIESCPHVDFYISATTSILNALHMPDFHRSWVEQKLIKPGDFNIQVVFTPEWLRVDRAPTQLKEQIRQKYAEHLSWLEPLDNLGRATSGFRSILEYINIDAEFDKDDFWKQVTPLDQFYHKNLLDIFPELSLLPRN